MASHISKPVMNAMLRMKALKTSIKPITRLLRQNMGCMKWTLDRATSKEDGLVMEGLHPRTTNTSRVRQRLGVVKVWVVVVGTQ